MNKIILTGRIQLTEKKTYKKHDGTEGGVGLFSIRLPKKIYQLIELKTFKDEIGEKVKFGELVYVEGVVKSKEHNERGYPELVIYELIVLSDTKKASTNKHEAKANNESSSSGDKTKKSLTESPEPIEPIEEEYDLEDEDVLVF